MAKTKLEKQFEAHDKAAAEARAKGASPRDAAIEGLVAEMMFRKVSGPR